MKHTISLAASMCFAGVLYLYLAPTTPLPAQYHQNITAAFVSIRTVTDDNKPF